MLWKHYVYIAYICVHLPLALVKKIAFSMCNIIYLLRITYYIIKVYAIQCVRSIALRRPWHFYIISYIAQNTPRTLPVVLRFYCRGRRVWWAVVGYQEKPSKMDLGRRWPPGASNIKLLMGLYYLLTIIVLYIIVLYGTERRGFH